MRTQEEGKGAGRQSGTRPDGTEAAERAGENGRVCRRCLLYEMAESAQYRNLYAYIEGLEEEIRAPKDLYEKRLARCKGCGLLLSGMCRACGCFVELRAAIAANRCPYERW